MPDAEPVIDVHLGTAVEALQMAKVAVTTAAQLKASGQESKAVAVLTAAVFVLVHQVQKLMQPTKSERENMV